ncbi:MAG: hypothetical protein AB8W37_13075 [Arsenophonus endosymbiont of Dermacentor nuttalli]
MDEAESKIRILERKVRLDIGNESDTSKLIEWEIYSVKPMILIGRKKPSKPVSQRQIAPSMGHHISRV